MFERESEEFKLGMRGERMREAVAQSLLAGVPSGLEAKIINADGLEQLDDAWYAKIWHGIAISDGDRTYTVGLPPHCKTAGYFSWGSEIKVYCVGPAEIYDQIGPAVETSVIRP